VYFDYDATKHDTFPSLRSRPNKTWLSDIYERIKVTWLKLGGVGLTFSLYLQRNTPSTAIQCWGIVW